MILIAMYVLGLTFAATALTVDLFTDLPMFYVEGLAAAGFFLTAVPVAFYFLGA